MVAPIVSQDLASISSENDLLARQDGIVERWLAADRDISDVAAVLEFMQQHPTWDFGKPGALVRFVEKFYRTGYEELLVDSVRKQPTFHTLWMLNRVANGEKNESIRFAYLSLFSDAAMRDDIDENARSWAREFSGQQPRLQ